MPRQSIRLLLLRLWHHISPSRRSQFSLLLLLMLLASFSEILSIGAVLPFLAVLTAPEQLFSLQIAQPVFKALNLTQPQQLLFPLTVTFVAAALVAGFMRLLLLWASTKLSYAAGADLSIEIYRRTLYQPYAVHCERNTSEIISGISAKTNAVIYIINMILTLISSSVMLIIILLALLSVNPWIALTAFGGFGFIYIIIIRLSRRQLYINSKRIAQESTQVIKSLQEGLGGIRDVLIDGSQDIYCQTYRNADLPMRRAQGSNAFIGSSPRYAMEALGMTLIALLAYLLAKQSDGIGQAIPTLGALALGAQRLLPVLQQAYGAWSGVQSEHASLHDALDLLDQTLPEYVSNPNENPIEFKQSIKLKQLSFSYGVQSSNVLTNINLNIPKGSRIGFIGSTGSGKSTLLDIIMGLVPPSNGFLEIDNQKITTSNHRAWQAHIAHVPQAIFLADCTIEENIAFGIPKDQIDCIRVKEAAKQAQIAETIEKMPKKYQTIVGERGIRLSGGQRQRIGIARALYKKADVIIFDEATSALDNKTEEAVMKAIDELNKDLTLLIIAHRLTTLKSCTHIVELVDGFIKQISNYENMFEKKNII